LLTISRCIPAHPAKLTDNANANIKFVNRFISRTPFPLHDGWHIRPTASKLLPRTVDVSMGIHRWDPHSIDG
jgi:hypothetical protein